MRIAKLAISFLLGYLAMYSWHSFGPSQASIEKIARVPTAIDTIRILGWNDVKCLTPDKLEEIYKRVRLQGDTNSSACNDSMNGKLNKFLSYTALLQLHLKESKWGDLAKMFNDPISYFESMRVQLEIDKTLNIEIAQAMQGDVVTLGPGFFELDPIAAVSVFLHETYHHNPQDPAHERCKGGDIPQANGGCDEFFTLHPSDKRGAYSITVAYLMAHGLENRSIGEDQREQLLNEAFLILATRFNSGFDQMAAVAEALTFLDTKGQIWIYHPWLKMVRQIPDPHKFMDKTPFKQIDFQHQKQGIFAINEQNKLFEWSYNSPLRKYYGDIISEEDEVLDATKLYLSSKEYAYTSILKSDLKVHILSYNQELKKYLFELLKPNTEALKNPAKRITTYDFFTAGILDDAGDVWKISQGSRSSDPKLFQESMYYEKGQKYQYISGGLNTDRFLGVTDKGELYQREGASLRVWKNTPKGLNKVVEGYLNYYGSTDAKEAWHWPRNKIEYDASDKTIFRVPFDILDMSVVRKLMAITGENFQTDKKVCGHPISFYDPFWPDVAWTIEDDSLMMGPLNGPHDDCRIVRENVKSAKIIKRSEGAAQDLRSNLFPVDLEVEYVQKAPVHIRSWK